MSEASQPSTSSTGMDASTSQPASEAAEQAGSSKKKFKQIQLPSPEQIMQEDAMNNCFVKTVLAGAMGGLAGVAFGLFSASLENAHGGIDAAPLSDAVKPTRVVLKEMLINMRDKSTSYAKGFALFGAVYSFNECVIEKYRAKHDKWNPAMAGCATGAMLAYSGGPKAMCFGCASIAAFSSAIEYFLDTH